MAGWRRTQGVVTEMRRLQGSRGTWVPVVRFATEDGRVLVHTSRAGSSQPSYHLGEIVPMVYDPRGTGRATIPHLFQLWGWETNLGILVGGQTVFGFIVVYLHPEFGL